MASSKPSSSVIDFGDSQDLHPELQFQEFSHDDPTVVATLETSQQYTSFPSSPDGDEGAELLGEEKKQTTPSFWEFKYYQNFFDVDTDQVLQRIAGSVLPMPGRATYLDRLIRPTPDLYGPFWISTTLIFSVAISANIAEYFMTEGKDRVWHYDLHKVSLAATAIYSYVFLLPFALFGILWYKYSTSQYTLLEIICVYGYSLFVYIPLSILWMIQVPWLQWTLMVIGAAVSGIVLAHTFWPAVSEGSKKLGVVLLCIVLLLHVLLAVGFVAYFFRPPHHVTPGHVTSVTVPIVSTVTSTTVTPKKLVDETGSTVKSAESVVNKIPRSVDSQALKNSIGNMSTIANERIKSVNNLISEVISSKELSQVSSKIS